VEATPYPPAPDDDRLAAVHATGLLDSAAEEAFDRIAELARLALGTPFAFLTVVDDQRSFWKAAIGTDPAGPRQNTRQESFCQYVVDSGEPLVLGDVRADERTRDNPSIASMGVIAWAGFPVHTPDGHVLGTLCAVDTAVRDWTAREVAVLERLAGVATREIALRAAAQEAERARDREHLFARIGELLRAGLDLAQVWQAIVHLAVPAVADIAFVHSVTPRTGLQVQAVLHRDRSLQAATTAAIGALGSAIGEAIGPGHVASTGTTQLITDRAAIAAELSRTQLASSAPFGVHSTIGVPLRARGQLVGVLTVVRTGQSAPYTDTDVALVEAITSRAALALDNALAYTQQRTSSLALQQALLPGRLPQPDHLQLASRYEPAAAGQVVGGDWYDAFLDRAGTTTLVIGDVAGHDINAAATMGQLRAMLRMAAHDGTLTPAGILTAVDTATEDLGTSVFTTALIARVDPAGPHPAPAHPTYRPAGSNSLLLTWSSAGHPQPVLLCADGTVSHAPPRPDRALGLDIPVLADQPAAARHDHRMRIEAGQTLLLYTDGLVERRDQDLDAGTARLLAELPALAGLPLEDFCDAVLEAMGPDSTDDVALLALRPHPDDRARPTEAGAAHLPGGEPPGGRRVLRIVRGRR
jgi:GAF domain-containing protein